jgi:hypothetical protein
MALDNEPAITGQPDETPAPEATSDPAVEETKVIVDQDDNAETPEGDTFPREYVERIRNESRGYRDRVNTAEARVDELSRALFTARAGATGTLADPSDLEYNAELLEDAGALAEAIETLTTAKPHLRARKLGGNVGQGVTGDQAAPTSLLAKLKAAV